MKTSKAIAYLALVYMAVMLLQIIRSMYVDAFEVVAGRVDLMGFALSVGIGMILTVYGVRNRLFFGFPILLIAIFLILLVFNLKLNTEESIIALMISRYGILTWLLLGMWASLSLYAIRKLLDEGKRVFFARVGVISCGFVFLLLFFLAYSYIGYRDSVVSTVAYQIVSSNAIVLICQLIIMLHVFMQSASISRKVANFPIYIFLFVASYLVYAIALMQSTSIVAFWIVTLPMILFTLVTRKGLVLKGMALLFIVVIGYVAMKWIFAGYLFEGTRLTGLSSDGVSNVSSLQSRLELLPMFWEQFMVSPVFGNYLAETRVGLYQGEYVHSIPLSLLTHTGIVGFLLLVAVWLYLYVSQQKWTDINAVFTVRLFLIVSLLGMIYAFFTWQPFWFFLGFMSVRSKPIKVLVN